LTGGQLLIGGTDCPAASEPSETVP